jgi:hypothetical protein
MVPEWYQSGTKNGTRVVQSGTKTPGGTHFQVAPDPKERMLKKLLRERSKHATPNSLSGG